MKSWIKEFAATWLNIQRHANWVLKVVRRTYSMSIKISTVTLAKLAQSSRSFWHLVEPDPWGAVGDAPCGTVACQCKEVVVPAFVLLWLWWGARERWLDALARGMVMFLPWSGCSGYSSSQCLLVFHTVQVDEELESGCVVIGKDVGVTVEMCLDMHLDLCYV